MKKIILMLTALAIYCNAESQSLVSNFGIFEARKDSAKVVKKLTWNAGFIFAPQGELNLKKIDNGFSGVPSLEGAVSIVYKKTAILGLYLINSNSLGIVIDQEISKKSALYLIQTRSITQQSNYTGLGFRISVAEGHASAFTEIGNEWNTGTPYLYTGLLIPFMLKRE